MNFAVMGDRDCVKKKGIDPQRYCGTMPFLIGKSAIFLDARNPGVIVSLMLTSKALFVFPPRNEKNEIALAGASRLGHFFVSIVESSCVRCFSFQFTRAKAPGSKLLASPLYFVPDCGALS